MMPSYQYAKFRLLQKYSKMRLEDTWYSEKIRAVMALSPEAKAAIGIKRTVRLVGNFPGLWQRTIEQTPLGSCRWGETLFVADGPADHYVVLNSMGTLTESEYRQKLHGAPPESVWGLHMEPAEYIDRLGYHADVEHSLIGRFYTNSQSLIARGGRYRPSPPYVHLHSGKSWDFLSRATPPAKREGLCVISSDLATLEGHVSRMKFLSKLDQSKLRVSIWGRGKSLGALRNHKGYLLNKWDAHSKFKYSVVIENSKSDLYWSEKFADAILGFSLPLYHGATDIGDYFPEDSFIRIDITDPDSLDKIEAILRDNPYSRRLPAIIEARRRILMKYNLYAFLDGELAAEQSPSCGERSPGLMAAVRAEAESGRRLG